MRDQTRGSEEGKALMSRVLKRGEKLREVAVYTCARELKSGCGSEIEFERSDVRSDQRDGSYVVCPVCKAWIDASLLSWKRAANRGRSK